MEEEETFTVRITVSTGYSVVQMTRVEIIEVIQEESRWLFVDGQMVDATTLESTSITQDNDLRLCGRLVGGSFCRAEIWNQVQEHWVGEESIWYSELYSPDWITYFCNKRIKENFGGSTEHLKEFISTYNLDVDYNCTVVKRIPKGLAGWYEAKIWNEETQNWVSEEIHLQAWLNSDDFLLYADGEKIDSETAYKDIIDRISKRRDTSIKVIVNSYCER